MPPIAVRGVPGFAPGTSADDIRKFRDEHIPIPDGGQLDPQALQAWAQLTRAMIAAEANEIAVRLNDGDADDIAAVRDEVDRLGNGLVDISTDLAVLFAQCELVLAGGPVPTQHTLELLGGVVTHLRKKFDIAREEAAAKTRAASAPAAPGTQSEVRGVKQADGDPGDESRN